MGLDLKIIVYLFSSKFKSRNKKAIKRQETNY